VINHSFKFIQHSYKMTKAHGYFINHFLLKLKYKSLTSTFVFSFKNGGVRFAGWRNDGEST